MIDFTEVDVFFVNRANNTVKWIYFNPDSDAGGQFVISQISFNNIIQAAAECNNCIEFFLICSEALLAKRLLTLVQNGLMGQKTNFQGKLILQDVQKKQCKILCYLLAKKNVK